jgi:hypothetical protein
MDLGIKKIVSDLVNHPSKILDIANAWITANNPTDDEIALAESRWNVCIKCDEFREHRDITGEPYCYDCKCPLEKKIFTKKFNECPQKKWAQSDNLLWPTTQKKNKSII